MYSGIVWKFGGRKIPQEKDMAWGFWKIARVKQSLESKHFSFEGYTYTFSTDYIFFQFLRLKKKAVYVWTFNTKKCNVILLNTMETLRNNVIRLLNNVSFLYLYPQQAVKQIHTYVYNALPCWVGWPYRHIAITYRMYTNV